MATWLFKSEPSSWSWDEQVAAGPAGTPWNGVRNHQAKQNLQAMQVGDEGFFYHSNEGKAVVGIVTVTRPYYPDPTDRTGKFGMVDIAAVQGFPQPVTLDDIRKNGRLADMMLVKNARLSVQPVRATEWALVCQMGGIDEGRSANSA